MSTIAAAVVLQNREPLGNFRNWVQALQTLLLDNASDPYLMVCEDDITWHPEAANVLHHDLMLKPPMKDIGCLSLYTPNKVVSHLKGTFNPSFEQAGYHGASQGKHTWGAQCLVFTRQQARELLSNDLFREKLQDPSRTKNVDRFIGEAFEAVGKKIYYRVPCLVNHDMGDNNSSLGYGDRPSLRTNYFLGMLR